MNSDRYQYFMLVIGMLALMLIIHELLTGGGLYTNLASRICFLILAIDTLVIRIKAYRR